MAFNGTTPEDLMRRGRYMVQWITEHDPNVGGAAQLKVIGYCIRDRSTPTWGIVFEHESHDVCQKLANILNEEDNNVRRT